MNTSRRTLFSAAAWSIPVLSLTAATPFAAASNACLPEFQMYLEPGPGTGNPAIFQATSRETSRSVTIRISSQLSSQTIDSQNEESFNFSQNGSGWNGGRDPSGSRDFAFIGFGPRGALVLNQRAIGTDVPAAVGADSQVLTFEFFDENNLAVHPHNVEFGLFDITSAESRYSWRESYWDAVYFDSTPSSISSTSGRDQGIGVGTSGDPFRRSGGHMPSERNVPPYVDTFRFDRMQSGTRMTYTQHRDRQGWHFVAISGVRFELSGGC